MKANLVPLIDVPKHRPWATVRWVRRMVYDERIGCYKVGGKVLVDLDELDAKVEQGRRSPRTG